MDPTELGDQFGQLQQALGWSEEHARRVHVIAPMLNGFLTELAEGFYTDIKQHRSAGHVLTDDTESTEAGKAARRIWLEELLTSDYGSDYLRRRLRVARREVEMGLDQAFANVAFSKLRTGLMRALESVWTGTIAELLDTLESVNLLIDLDLAVVQVAYAAERNARIREDERLATIAQLAGGIANELRTPLYQLKSSIYYLRSVRRLRPEKLGEHLGRIDHQVGIADSVVTALSDFADLPTPQMIPFDVSAAIQAVVIGQSTPNDVDMRVESRGNVFAVGDSAQTQIAIGNLLRNAIDAMPDGGSVTIAAEQRNESVHIHVRDTGIGITTQDASHIMEPLFTTKVSGIGLGLAITRAIVENHGGDISVTSEPGEGSIFTVRLRGHIDGTDTA